MNSILFICIGNICRSPMAEGLLKHARPDVAVLSAGINAVVGEPADPLSVALMRERGIDIGEHRARSLVSWMANEADVILTMDAAQKRFIETRYPESQGKVFRLCEDRQCDISDPYRHGSLAFMHAFDLISQGVNELVVRLAHHGEKQRYDLTAIREKQQLSSENAV